MTYDPFGIGAEQEGSVVCTAAPHDDQITIDLMGGINDFFVHCADSDYSLNLYVAGHMGLHESMQFLINLGAGFLLEIGREKRFDH